MRWLRVPTPWPCLRGALASALVLMSSGCALGYYNPHFWIPSEAKTRVEEAAFRYNNALRFGNLEMALKSVEPESRDAFLAAFDADAPRAIRFTDVEIRSVTMGPEREQARVLISMRFYRLPSVQEIAVTHEQRWRYDPKDALWYVSPEPERFLGNSKAVSSTPGPVSGSPSLVP